MQVTPSEAVEGTDRSERSIPLAYLRRRQPDADLAKILAWTREAADQLKSAHLPTAREHLEQLILLPTSSLSLQALQGLLELCQYFYYMGELADAKRIALLVLDASRAADDRRLVRRALTHLSLLEHSSGDQASALAFWMEAADIARSLSTPSDQFLLWLNLSAMLNNLGDFTTSVEANWQARALLDQHETLNAYRGQLAATLGAAYCMIGDYESAIAHLESTSEYSPAPGSPRESVSWMPRQLAMIRSYLSTSGVEHANEHLLKTKQYAALSGSPLALGPSLLMEELVSLALRPSGSDTSSLEQAVSLAGQWAPLRLHALQSGREGCQRAGNLTQAIRYSEELTALRGTYVHLPEYKQFLDWMGKHAGRDNRGYSLPSTAYSAALDPVNLRELMLQAKLQHTETEAALQSVNRTSAQAKEDIVRLRREIYDSLPLQVKQFMEVVVCHQGRNAEQPGQPVSGRLSQFNTGTRHRQARLGFMARRLAEDAGFDAVFQQRISMAIQLLDIGLIGLPDAIVFRRGALGPEDQQVLMSHCLIGEGLLSGLVADLDVDPTTSMARQIALSHHEWWDGVGFPHGLAGEAIPIAARLAAVVDVFDALTHSRAYRPQWPVERALRKIEALSGRQFDPVLVPCFVSMVTELTHEYGHPDLACSEDQDFFSGAGLGQP